MVTLTGNDQAYYCSRLICVNAWSSPFTQVYRQRVGIHQRQGKAARSRPCLDAASATELRPQSLRPGACSPWAGSAGQIHPLAAPGGCDQARAPQILVIVGSIKQVIAVLPANEAWYIAWSA